VELIAATDNNLSIRAVAEPHSQKPDKLRPHVCAVCQRSFARLEHLSRHERTHTQEKPFKCPECRRCFSRRDLLRRHRQKIHRMTTPSRPGTMVELTARVAPAQCTAPNNSAAALIPGARTATACIWPRENMTNAEGIVMQMFASGNASSARDTAAQSCHPSLIRVPIQPDQGGAQYNLTKVDGPRSAPLLPGPGPRFNFFEPAWPVDSLQYDGFCSL